MRIFVYGGGLVLLGVLAWAVLGTLQHHSFGFDTRCQQRALSCGVLSGFLVPVLTLALVSAFFLLGRLWYLRLGYLRTARDRPKEMVPTAGSIIGEVVGRDELCRVVIADLRDPGTRRPHVIVGGIGTGKTALLVRLTELLARQRAVPVAVRLRDARRTLDFGELARKSFIADLRSSILSDAEGEKVWRQLRKEGRIVVLADGLEEALGDDGVEADRDNVIQLAIRHANRDQLPLVIASRPHDPLRGTDAALVELEPLSEEAALDYIQHGDPGDDEHRIDWIVETADVTESPLYLQVARRLHRAGLLTYLSANGDGRPLDTRGVDRSGLRVRLLETWQDALVSGHFPVRVALSRADRQATIEQLSALACIGLRDDTLQVRLEDFESLWQPPGDSGQPCPIAREVDRRLSKARRPRDVKLAATWGTQLQLVEAQSTAVRFPHSILQAYLGSRLIAEAMADPGFAAEALGNAGRELLIALVMHSRAAAQRAARARGGRGGRPAGLSGALTGPAPPDLTALLCEKARGRGDAKALDLYATALELDAVEPSPAHQAIATEIAANWHRPQEREPRTLEHAKLNLIRRFGAAARAMARRHDEPDVPPPAYRELFAISRDEPSYRVRLAAAQEIGAGGDDALAALDGMLGPANGERASRDREDAAGQDPDRAQIMRAWLVPLLVGSAATEKWRTVARGLLRDWLSYAYQQRSGTGRERSGPSLEIALAQGFKYAANRRRGHPHAPDDARAYLTEQAQQMLGYCDFWFTRLTLLHALTLWQLPDGADHHPGHGVHPDYKALVGHWCGTGSRARRDGEHPFVRQAKRLAVRALETGQPERYLWIDEIGVVSRVGSSPARPGRRRIHQLWIPPSTGWTALNARAQQLVADVLLLLNLAEGGDQHSRDRDERLERTSKNYLPPCITEDRSPLSPDRPLGTAGAAAPGAGCTSGCDFGLCPYPPKGSQPHRQELSEAFCRRQQRLVAPGPRRSRAPWQEMSQARLRRFWRELGQPVARAGLEEDDGDRYRRRSRRR